jgi:hypothetical protein
LKPPYPLKPSRPRALLVPLLALVALVGCSRSSSEPTASAPVDCGEDLGCFIARTPTCAPTSVLHSEQHALTGLTVRTTFRHELVGRVQGRCHLRRTRLSLDVQPGSPEERVQQVLADLGPRAQPLMQCLYTETQAAEVMRHLQRGALTSGDLEPCYPGDGGCGEVPLLAPSCVLGECLLGRWTFTCEANAGRDIYRCEGSRLSDVSRGCWSRCNAHGQEEVECRPVRRKSGAESSPTGSPR